MDELLTNETIMEPYDDILVLNDCYIKEKTIYSDVLKNYDYKNDERFKKCVSIMVKPSITNITDAIIIDEPLIILRKVHKCYGHALIDNIFIDFCIIKEIKEKYGHDIKYMFRYLGRWDFLQSILPVKLFKPDANKFYLFKKIYFHKLDDYPRLEWSSRSPFNLHYMRNPRQRNLYPEIDINILKNNMFSFKQNVLNKYLNKNTDLDFTINNVIIIDRKKNKLLSSNFKNQVIDIIKNLNYQFNGVFILEDMEYKHQIELFYKNNIVIAFWGSAAVNMIYMSKNSNYIEIGYTKQHQRLADLMGINYSHIPRQLPERVKTILESKN